MEPKKHKIILFVFNILMMVHSFSTSTESKPETGVEDLTNKYLPCIVVVVAVLLGLIAIKIICMCKEKIKKYLKFVIIAVIVGVVVLVCNYVIQSLPFGGTLMLFTFF